MPRLTGRGMGATAIEYGTVPVSPPPKKRVARMVRRMPARYIRTPAGAITRRQLSTGALTQAQQSQQNVLSQLRGTTLGDDTLDAQSQTAAVAADMAEADWRRELLATNKAMLEAHKHWADGDRFQKWIAIAATLAIPLSAAVWRMIFRAGKRDE